MSEHSGQPGFGDQRGCGRPGPDDLPGDLLPRIEGVVGRQGVLAADADMAGLLVDQRGRYRGRAPLVARPGSTDEVAAVVRLCHEAGVGIVPQGGNTGLVGGSVPDESGAQIVLSLARMRRVRALEPENFSATVEAGCVLADVQGAAEAAGLLFPLSLAAEGSCQIGGNLATNAGGTAVLRYGNARDLVLGLEVVLADGTVWPGLRGLRKDNTGYDLKQLFIGSEGTLGIITAAVVKLFPRPRQSATAFAAVTSAAGAQAFLARSRALCGEEVTAFEYLDRASLGLVLEHIEGVRAPLGGRHEHYVLIELTSARPGEDLGVALERALAEGFEAGEVRDAALATSSEQAAALWRLRETVPEAERHAGAGIKHDVSVPLGRVPELLERGRALMAEVHPGALVIAFGHLGDGNIHFNLSQPEEMSAENFLAREPAVHHALYDLVAELGGSFSAEHGVGRLRREELVRYKPAVEVELMRRLKRTLDPKGIFNPGKIV